LRGADEEQEAYDYLDAQDLEYHMEERDEFGRPVDQSDDSAVIGAPVQRLPACVQTVAATRPCVHMHLPIPI
jgi:hypothetical protein